VDFKDINDIPISLIKGVAMCLREKKCVCRMCFFGERSLSEEDVGAVCSASEHKWLKPIAVIPGVYSWRVEGAIGGGFERVMKGVLRGQLGGIEGKIGG